MQDASLLVRGWASIPRGGLERHEPILTGGGGARLAQCVLSEASSNNAQLPPGYLVGQGPSATTDDGEAVWLSLRLSLFLFLATSPTDAVPYACVRLQDAVLRDVNRQNRHLILAGKPRTESKPGDRLSVGPRPGMPFGDATRMPLPLCFLLADGRFQPFEALWLELQFNSDEELELWARELGVACGIGGGQDELRKGPRTMDSSEADHGADVSGSSTTGPSLPRMLGSTPMRPTTPHAEPPVSMHEEEVEGPRPAG